MTLPLDTRLDAARLDHPVFERRDAGDGDLVSV
jgi:hypothetical protein